MSNDTNETNDTNDTDDVYANPPRGYDVALKAQRDAAAAAPRAAQATQPEVEIVRDDARVPLSYDSALARGGKR